MSGDKEVKYEISGDSSGLAAAMSQAQQSIRDFAGNANSELLKVGKAFEVCTKALMGIAAAVAGGAFFKACIDDSRKLAGEVNNLSKRFNVSAEDASALNTALGDIGSDADTYIGTFDKFAKQIKTNEAGLQAMGLQTRDANGNLRDANDLYTEALQLVGQYRPGLDQTTAAMTLFGKSVEDAMRLGKLNNTLIEEAKQKNRELHLNITQEGIAGSKAYGRALNDVGDVLLGVKNVIGQAVMPIFTSMAEYFASTGPYVIKVFQGAVSGLLLVFRGLEMGVKIAVGAVFEIVSGLIDQFGNLSDLISRVMRGDWDGVVQAAKAIAARSGEGFKRIFVDNVKDAYREAIAATEGDMERVWGGGTDVKPPPTGDKHMGDGGGGAGGAGGGDKSRMGEFEERLAKSKEAFAILEAGRQMDKESEIAYWQSILGQENLGAADETKIRTKVAQLRIEIMSKGRSVEEQIGAERIKHREDEDLAALESARISADNEVALQEMTQTRRAELEVQFEERRHEIRTRALKEREAMMKEDPDTNPAELKRIHDEILMEDAQFENRKLQLSKQATQLQVQDANRIRDSMASGFASVLDQYRKGTITITGLVKGLAKTIIDVWVQMLEQKAAKWLAEHVMEIAGNKVAALSDIAASAAAAGAAGTASFAGAPWPVDMGAAAFGASMYAAAMAYAPAASAAGGYDIPSHLNPITQLHAREMVLPAKYADTIRGMADGNTGGGGDVVINLKGSRMGNFFMLHQDDLMKALADAMRSNRFPRGR
jgi:hypothetical protein